MTDFENVKTEPSPPSVQQLAQGSTKKLTTKIMNRFYG